jgi:hypothetical protein
MPTICGIRLGSRQAVQDALQSECPAFFFQFQSVWAALKSPYVNKGQLQSNSDWHIDKNNYGAIQQRSTTAVSSQQVSSKVNAIVPTRFHEAAASKCLKLG